MLLTEFREWPKISRLSRRIIVTEKIDGTNAMVHVPDNPRDSVSAGSRSRWLMTEDDNHGFARWVAANAEELRNLTPGYHYGEWWGPGIGKRYRGFGPKEKKLSLFNTERWSDAAVRPACCDVVPVLWDGEFDTDYIRIALEDLRRHGSRAAPGCMNPEGVVIFHTASGHMFKKTCEDDESHKQAVV